MNNYKLHIEYKSGDQSLLDLGQHSSMDIAIKIAIQHADAIGLGHAYEEKIGQVGWYINNSFGPDIFCGEAIKALEKLYLENYQTQPVEKVSVIED